MSLSKKHYIAISNIIRNNYDSKNNKGEYEPSINTKIISDLATYFRDENLKRLERVKGARFTFDQCKFIEACFPNYSSGYKMINKTRHSDSIEYLNKIDHEKIDLEIKEHRAKSLLKRIDNIEKGGK